MKLKLFAFFLITIIFSQYAFAKERLVKNDLSSAQSYIETDTYKIYLKDKCPIYATVCDKISLALINKKNKKKTILNGMTDNDGWRYDFKGYAFLKEEYRYKLIPSNKNDTDWVFTIIEGQDHQVFKEVGEWNYSEWGYDQDNYWETDTYKILYLSGDCPSNSIDCLNIYFQVINKKNKRQITVKATEEHPPPSYNLYGYTFDSGTLYYIISYFPGKQFLDVSFKKGWYGILHEDVIQNTVDDE